MDRLSGQEYGVAAAGPFLLKPSLGKGRTGGIECYRKEFLMMIEMKVKFLTFDSTSNGFVVLLMDLSNKTGLPIWIGPFEANAIAMKLKKMASQRPMTHDLIHSILSTLRIPGRQDRRQ